MSLILTLQLMKSRKQTHSSTIGNFQLESWFNHVNSRRVSEIALPQLTSSVHHYHEKNISRFRWGKILVDGACVRFQIRINARVFFISFLRSFYFNICLVINSWCQSCSDISSVRIRFISDEIDNSDQCPVPEWLHSGCIHEIWDSCWCDLVINK